MTTPGSLTEPHPQKAKQEFLIYQTLRVELAGVPAPVPVLATPFFCATFGCAGWLVGITCFALMIQLCIASLILEIIDLLARCARLPAWLGSPWVEGLDNASCAWWLLFMLSTRLLNMAFLFISAEG